MIFFYLYLKKFEILVKIIIKLFLRTYFSDESDDNPLTVNNSQLPMVPINYFSQYLRLKRLIEHLDVMDEYLKIELRSLEKELMHAQEEVLKKILVKIF